MVEIGLRTHGQGLWRGRCCGRLRRRVSEGRGRYQTLACSAKSALPPRDRNYHPALSGVSPPRAALSPLPERPSVRANISIMFSSVLSLARRPALHAKCSPIFSSRAAYASTSQNSRLASKRSVIEADTSAYDELEQTVQILESTPARAKPSADAFNGPCIPLTNPYRTIDSTSSSNRLPRDPPDQTPSSTT